MKFRRFLISLSIATALLALSISDVKACTCRFVGPPCEEYWRSEAVFAGKVIKKSTFYVEEGEGDSRHKYQQVLVRYIRVDIISAKDAQDLSPKGKWGYTDKDGRYKIDWLPPGDYYLGVGLVGANSNLCPYPRILMPDFGDAKKPKVVSLEEGQKIEDQNISLPSFTPDLEFEVEVVWPDGSPVEAAVVALHSDGPIAQVEVQKDPNGKPGHFLVKAFKACSYLVTAFTYGHPGEPGGGTQWHEETKIDSSANFTMPIRLTLSKPGFCVHLQPK